MKVATLEGQQWCVWRFRIRHWRFQIWQWRFQIWQWVLHWSLKRLFREQIPIRVFGDGGFTMKVATLEGQQWCVWRFRIRHWRFPIWQWRFQIWQWVLHWSLKRLFREQIPIRVFGDGGFTMKVATLEGQQWCVWRFRIRHWRFQIWQWRFQIWQWVLHWSLKRLFREQIPIRVFGDGGFTMKVATLEGQQWCVWRFRIRHWRFQIWQWRFQIWQWVLHWSLKRLFRDLGKMTTLSFIPLFFSPTADGEWKGSNRFSFPSGGSSS
ncbi:hypothetical protein U1Q18_031594 [Sarracenia purpurea var. burkii]